MLTEKIILPNQTECIIYSENKESQQTDPIAIYFHGGGLIYGSKNDLPHSLINTFLKKGINIISIDYFLAPNSSISTIIKDTFTTVDILIHQLFPNQSYLLIGRSSGSFLMFQTMQLIIQNGVRFPSRLINFYGYANLEHLHKHQNIFPSDEFKNFDFELPIKDDPTFERFILYKEALDSQSLNRLLNLTANDSKKFIITDDILQQFPPSFHTASTTDKEVPFLNSKNLSKKIPNSLLVPVYYLEHDFLKVNHPEVAKVFLSLEEWLDSVF